MFYETNGRCVIVWLFAKGRSCATVGSGCVFNKDALCKLKTFLAVLFNLSNLNLKAVWEGQD